MGFLIEIVLELFADLFITEGSDRFANRKQRQYMKKLRKWAREYEWFEYVYKDERFTKILENNDEIKKMLLDKSYFRSLDLNLDERRRFEELLYAKYNDKSVQL
ncbi:hypothetical protein [Paenibacillus prosopidis]|uniref:Uncharacterized protein n=1 Tax=Paenibacillus prosopidis TaxID=630520 RepID=A0A368W5J8_9BACL|nr:hypothetical protein [Paenibacillus prosopidis]RCW50318.1 hypothetical protein DFP97_103339 [Paenibacillus prosopidis]